MSDQPAGSLPHIDTHHDELRSHLLATSMLSIAAIDRALAARQQIVDGDIYMQILETCAKAGSVLSIEIAIAGLATFVDVDKVFTAPTHPDGYIAFSVDNEGLHTWGVDAQRGPRWTSMIDPDQTRRFLSWLICQFPIDPEEPY